MTEMTRTAIQSLSRDANCFVLMVEGGRIDHANHAGNAYSALDETVSLSDAVRVAVQTAPPDTLIIVTADHSHTLNFVGYPLRGNQILGKVHGTDGEEGDRSQLATDLAGSPTPRSATPTAPVTPVPATRSRPAPRSIRMNPAAASRRPAAPT